MNTDRAAPHHHDPASPASADVLPRAQQGAARPVRAAIREGQRGLREEDRTGTQTPADAADGVCAGAAIAELVLAEVVPSCCHSTFCFLLKQGHSDDASIDLQCQEYLGSLPARSSLPARPPAVCKFTGNRIYSTY